MPSVLIVDDERPFLLSLQDGLAASASSVSVLTAANGEEAVRLLRSSKIDLVVTDLKMPVMDGFELLAYLSRNHPRVPVIVMTAFGTPLIEQQLRKSGTLWYVEKPLDLDALRKKIAEALAQGSASYIRGFVLANFLQFVELERKSCTLQVHSRGRLGQMQLRDGQLVSAESDSKDGDEAAMEILGWEEAEIEMFAPIPDKPRDVHASLQFLLMEALRLKDERGNKTRQASGTPAHSAAIAKPWAAEGAPSPPKETAAAARTPPPAWPAAKAASPPIAAAARSAPIAATAQAIALSAAPISKPPQEKQPGSGSPEAPRTAPKLEKEADPRKIDSSKPQPPAAPVSNPPEVNQQPSCTPEEKMALESHLAELKDIKGYKASGIMSFTGELLVSDSVDTAVDLAFTGATFNDIFRAAHTACEKIGLESCREASFATPKGTVLMRCSGTKSKVHCHIITIMAIDGNQALAKMKVDKMVDPIMNELA